MKLQLIVSYIRPPIPTKEFNWSVIAEGYEPGMIIGYGESIQQAIADYIDQHRDRHGSMPRYSWK